MFSLASRKKTFGIKSYNTAEGHGFDVKDMGDSLAIIFQGNWLLSETRFLSKSLRQVLQKIRKKKIKSAQLSMHLLENLDTAGAMLILDFQDDLEMAGIAIERDGLLDKHRLLFNVVSGHPRTAKIKPSREISPLARLITDVGETATILWRDCGLLVSVLGAVGGGLLRTIAKPKRFRFHAFVHQIEHAGVKAAPIIMLICLLIGAVIMQQGVAQLKYYAADQFAVNLLGVLSLREVGILLTSVMIAGRSGAAFTAEIGSMKMREELDAMRSIGMSPLDVLIIPRVCAMVIVLPLLTFLGDLMCLIGGGIYAALALKMDPIIFMERLQDAVTPVHLMVGLMKAPFAGLIIALVGVMEGMRVRGSAESLGRRVRASVVKAIFLVIIFDAVFAIFLSSIGI